MAPPSPPDAPSGRLHIGRVARPHGLRGELKLSTFDHEAPSLRKGVTIHLADDEGRARSSHELLVVRRTPDGIIVQAAGIDGRSAADALIGLQVLVDESALPPLGEGEVWAYKLAGFHAVDENGKHLGDVDGVLTGAAHDLLQLRTPAGVFEVPLVEHFVPRIDEASRTLVIRPIPGLLDDGSESAADEGRGK